MIDPKTDDPFNPGNGENRMIYLNMILGLYGVCVYRFEKDASGHKDKYVTTVFADGQDLSKHRECIYNDLCTEYGYIKYHENIDLVVKFKEPEPEKPKPPVEKPKCNINFIFIKPGMNISDTDNVIFTKNETYGLDSANGKIDCDVIMSNLTDILNSESTLKSIKVTSAKIGDTDILVDNNKISAAQNESYNMYVFSTNIEYDSSQRPRDIRVVGDEFMMYPNGVRKLMYFSNPCFNSSSNSCKITALDIHNFLESFVNREFYGLDDPEMPQDEKDEIQFFDTITVHYIDNTKDLVIESLDRTNMASTEIDTSKINYISCLEK